MYGCAKPQRVRVPTALADALGGQERHPGAVAVAAQGPHITQRRARLWVLEPAHAQLLRGAAGHVEHLSKKTRPQIAAVSDSAGNCILRASASLARLRAKQGSVAPSSLAQVHSCGTLMMPVAVHTAMNLPLMSADTGTPSASVKDTVPVLVPCIFTMTKARTNTLTLEFAKQKVTKTTHERNGEVSCKLSSEDVA
jgi:hypothetical protein